MSNYNPDQWLVVKINSNAPHYRVFATWSGGYLGGDSWKLNSGITAITEDENHYHFSGSSGSVYSCHKDSYGSNGYGWSVLNRMIDDATVQGYDIVVIKEDANFATLNYTENQL